MAVKLTKGFIDKAKPAIDGGGEPKVTYFFDEIQPGLALRITPNGAKSFIFQARVGRGRRAAKTRVTIGGFGQPWTVETARTEAARLLSKVKVDRVDPVAERRAEEEAGRQLIANSKTVNQVCDEYLKAAVHMPTKRKRPKSAASLKIDEGRLLRHVRPLLGTQHISNLTKADIDDFRNKVASGTTAGTFKTKKRGKAVVRGGQGTANRVLNLFGAVMSFAKDRSYIATNPVHGVIRYDRPKVAKRPRTKEIEAIGAQLREEAANHPSAVAIIRELALTGARYGEIAKLHKKWTELDGALLRLPDSKSRRERIIILGKPSIDVLKAVPKRAKSPYVFPAERGKSHYQATPKVWDQIRKNAGVHFRLQDWRHNFSSIATELGYPKPIVSALLGHSKADITDEYIHVAPEALRAAADAISEAIARLLDGEAATVSKLGDARKRRASSRQG
jgi:integrase